LADKDPKDVLQDLAQNIEREVKEAISYLDREVVPQIRAESTQALRTASEKLRHLADYLDDRRNRS
jgi:hypothetical protein